MNMATLEGSTRAVASSHLYVSILPRQPPRAEHRPPGKVPHRTELPSQSQAQPRTSLPIKQQADQQPRITHPPPQSQLHVEQPRAAGSIFGFDPPSRPRVLDELWHGPRAPPVPSFSSSPFPPLNFVFCPDMQLMDVCTTVPSDANAALHNPPSLVYSHHGAQSDIAEPPSDAATFRSDATTATLRDDPIASLYQAAVSATVSAAMPATSLPTVTDDPRSAVVFISTPESRGAPAVSTENGCPSWRDLSGDASMFEVETLGTYSLGKRPSESYSSESYSFGSGSSGSNDCADTRCGDCTSCIAMAMQYAT